MKTFEYEGYSAQDGRRVSGHIEADSLKNACERLAERGILPEQVHPVTEGGAAPRRRFGVADRARWMRELAALVGAGLNEVAALEVLLDGERDPARHRLLAAVRDRIREGSSLSAALEAAGAWEPLEVAMIRAGERAGALREVLERLAHYLEHSARARERAASALIYPGVVLTLVVLISLAMFGWLLPMMVRLWDDAGVSLPAFTRFVVGLGRWLRWALPLGLAIGLFAGLALRAAVRRDGGARAAWDLLHLRLPIWGELHRRLVAHRFARVLAMLLKGGVPMVEALPLAALATGSAFTARHVEAATEAIRHGASPVEALARVETLRTELPHWISVGLAGGRLPDILDIAADRLYASWEHRLTRLLSLLEPLLVVGLGVIVFVLTLAMVLPILSLHRGLR